MSEVVSHTVSPLQQAPLGKTATTLTRSEKLRAFQQRLLHDRGTPLLLLMHRPSAETQLQNNSEYAMVNIVLFYLSIGVSGGVVPSSDAA